MAKSKINKSQAIRDFLQQNPSLKPKEVVTQLGTKGIKVTPSLVYFIKSRQKRRARKQKREQAMAAASSSGTASAIDVLLRLKSLAHDVGGIRSLKQLVDAYAE